MKDLLKFLQTHYFQNLTDADIETIERHYKEWGYKGCKFEYISVLLNPCFSCHIHPENFSWLPVSTFFSIVLLFNLEHEIPHAQKGVLLSYSPEPLALISLIIRHIH